MCCQMPACLHGDDRQFSAKRGAHCRFSILLLSHPGISTEMLMGYIIAVAVEESPRFTGVRRLKTFLTDVLLPVKRQ